MYTVVAQRTIAAAPIESIWGHLTQPSLLARWFADTDRFEADNEFRFEFGDGDFFTGRIVEWTPNVSLDVIWRFVGMGPEYRVLISLLPRKAGSEVSIQDRGALTLDEAECLRVGWSEFLMRLEKAACFGQRARFNWRKAITFTADVHGRKLGATLATLGDTAWYSEAFEGGCARIEQLEADRIVASYSTNRWGAAETQIRIKHERVSEQDYLFVAHEGWKGLPRTMAEQERRRFVGLWLDHLGAITG